MNLKNIVTSLILTVLIIPQSILAGCFPREDAYMELISKEPDIDCLHITYGSLCLNIFELSVRNHCKETLIHKGVEIPIHEDYIYFPAGIEILDIPQKIGESWNEVFYYKNNPNKKITLSFQINKNVKIFSKTDNLERNSVKIIGLRPLINLVISSILLGLIIYLGWKFITKKSA